MGDQMPRDRAPSSARSAIVSSASRRRSQAAGAARHAVDLRAADGEAIMVELLAEPRPVHPALIEGEIDDRALRTQRLKRQLQALRRPASGTRTPHPAPTTRANRPWRPPGLVLRQSLDPSAPATSRRHAEGSATSTSAPARRAKSAVISPTVPRPRPRPAARDPGPEMRHRPRTPRRLHEDAVGADRPICATRTPRIGSIPPGSVSIPRATDPGMPALVPESVGDEVARGKTRRPRIDHPPDLQYPRKGTGSRVEGSPGDEDPARLVPARMQVRVGRLQECQLGPRRKAGERQIQPDLALAGRALAIVGP